MKKISLILLSCFVVVSVFAGKVRVVEKQDGTIIVIHPAPNSIHGKQGAIERIYNKTYQGLPYEDIDISKLPTDREDRHAWEWDTSNKKVKINQTKKTAKDAEKAAKVANKTSGKNKLKTGQALTQAEINALFE